MFNTSASKKLLIIFYLVHLSLSISPIIAFFNKLDYTFLSTGRNLYYADPLCYVLKYKCCIKLVIVIYTVRIFKNCNPIWLIQIGWYPCLIRKSTIHRHSKIIFQCMSFLLQHLLVQWFGSVRFYFVDRIFQ